MKFEHYSFGRALSFSFPSIFISQFPPFSLPIPYSSPLAFIHFSLLLLLRVSLSLSPTHSFSLSHSQFNSTMTSQTLDDDKPLLQEDEEKEAAAAAEPMEEEGGEKGNSESEMKQAEDNGGEVDPAEEKKDEVIDQELEKEEDETEAEEGSAEEEESDSKKSKIENEPTTPASGGTDKRPIRERKSVERYTVSSPSKFPKSSNTNTLSIEQGSGTQLKDIPNVAFKLSKQKPDDSLRALHNILFGKRAKAQHLKKNIGLFSGYVWVENEEKQRAKIKEKIEKCVKDKLVEFCDILNIPITKTALKKEDLSAKLLEFLESPHATTDILLADKEKKGKKRTKKRTPSKPLASETPAKKEKQTSQVGKKRKQSSDVEEDDAAELPYAKDDYQEGEDALLLRSESDDEESEEDQKKTRKDSSKKSMKEDSTTAVKVAKSSEKTPKKSTSEKTVIDSTSVSLSNSKKSASKKQKIVKQAQDNEGKVANKKRTDKSSKDLAKDQGKGKSSKKAKAEAEPSKEELHAVAVDILKKVDFNTATLSDILKQLGTHFGLNLMNRKAEVKDIITDVINNMTDVEDGEDSGSDGADDADEGDA